MLFPFQLCQPQPAGDLHPPGAGEHVGKVLLHGTPGEEAVLLKEQGSGAEGQAGDPAGDGVLQPGQNPQQGGLAAAGGAGQGGDPRLRQGEGEAVQHPLLSKGDGDLLQTDHGDHLLFIRFSRAESSFSRARDRRRTTSVQANREGVSR